MNQGIAELVKKIQEGERELITELWEKFRPLWTKWARITSLCGYEQEDLHQQSYLILMNGLRCFDSTLGVPFEAYYQLSLRRWRVNKFRRPQMILLFETEENEPLVVDEGINVEEEAMRSTMMEEVLGCMATFTPQERQLICGYYLEYKSLGELADSLHMSYKSVENKKARLLETLRKKLDQK